MRECKHNTEQAKHKIDLKASNNMARFEVKSCYTSCACNRTPFSVDWGKNGLICYAYSNAVAIYKCEVEPEPF